MKRILIITGIWIILASFSLLFAQVGPVYPTVIKPMNFLGVTKPLTEIPDMTPQEMEAMWAKNV